MMKTIYSPALNVLKPGGYPVMTAHPLVLVGWKNRRTGKMRYGKHMSLEDYDALMQNDYSHAPAYPVVVGKTYFKPMLKHEIRMPRNADLEEGLPAEIAVLMYVEDRLLKQGFAVTCNNGQLHPTAAGRPIIRELNHTGLVATYYQPAEIGRDYAPGVHDR